MENKYPIGGYAPGNYQCHCTICGGGFTGDKRSCQCEPCAIRDREKFDALSPVEQHELMKRNAEAIKDMFSKWNKPGPTPLPEPILNDDDVIDLGVKDGGLKVVPDLEEQANAIYQEYCSKNNLAYHLVDAAIFSDGYKAAKMDAVEFGEWLRTFEPLYKEDGYWVLESQISTEQLYALYQNQKIIGSK